MEKGESTHAVRLGLDDTRVTVYSPQTGAGLAGPMVGGTALS